MFKTNEFRLYSQLNADTITEMDHLTLKTQKKIWKDIWATPTGHNSNAAWLKVVKNKWKYLERHLSLSFEDVKHRFWYTKLSKFHGRIATELKKTLCGTEFQYS